MCNRPAGLGSHGTGHVP